MMAPDFRSQRLAESGVQAVAFINPADDQGCSGNRRHAELCRTCNRVWIPGPQLRAAAYFDRDGDSQCRNLIDGGVHVASVPPDSADSKHLALGGAFVNSPALEGASE